MVWHKEAGEAKAKGPYISCERIKDPVDSTWHNTWCFRIAHRSVRLARPCGPIRENADMKAVGDSVYCVGNFRKYLLLLCRPRKNAVQKKQFIAFATVPLFRYDNCISSVLDAAFEVCVIRPRSHNNAKVSAGAHEVVTAVRTHWVALASTTACGMQLQRRGGLRELRGLPLQAFPTTAPVLSKKRQNGYVCVAESFGGVSTTIGTTSGLTVFASRRRG